MASARILTSWKVPSQKRDFRGLFKPLKSYENDKHIFTFLRFNNENPFSYYGLRGLKEFCEIQVSRTRKFCENSRTELENHSFSFRILELKMQIKNPQMPCRRCWVESKQWKIGVVEGRKWRVGITKRETRNVKWEMRVGKGNKQQVAGNKKYTNSDIGSRQ